MTDTLHRLHFSADFDGVADEESREWLYNAKVYLLEQRIDFEPKLLATLRGASLESRTSRVFPTWQLDVSHATARDFEHDRVILARIGIGNPQLPTAVSPALTQVYGVIESICGYADQKSAFIPRAQGHEDGQLHAESTPCSRCGEEHPEGRYQPTDWAELQALVGSVIRVDLTPLSSETLSTASGDPAPTAS